MPNVYDLVVNLTSEKLPESERLRMLGDFASKMGWRPSYYLIELPLAGEFANAHLVVEHGLQPSAVITFLDKAYSFTDIQLSDQNRLLSISYNNLVDWQLYVERDKVTYCYNRKKPVYIETKSVSRSDYDGLHNEAFEQIVGRKPTPNLPSLDQALIETISSWRRILAADLDYAIPTTNISSLFNAILFTRTIEDHHRRIEPSENQLLLEEWYMIRKSQGTIREAIMSSLKKLIDSDIPKSLIDEEKLTAFDRLDSGTVQGLLYDFYNNKFAPYSYDFSVMSKHALSRIYEHYTALLHVEESPQMTMFPRLPEEEWNKKHGSIYTPQFIARYFARFLRNQLPHKLFRQLKTIDPACGSGIFLRTLLELQCDPLQDNVTTEMIKQAFANVEGWDNDENAINATLYSLASLHLVLTDSLPPQLEVKTVESIKYYQEHEEYRGSFDAVIMNPPFVALGAQPDEFRETLATFLGKEAMGRIDTYLAFLKLALELIKPGGYALFVLPHSFLLADSAKEIRRRLANESWIHCLADLSAIRVFENLGTYIILLVFQKKPSYALPAPPATIIKCQDYVGHALEDSLDGRMTKTPYYSVYEVEQEEFNRDYWVILPPSETGIRDRIETLPRLEKFVEIREGLITGADDIFIINDLEIPKGEGDIYASFLPDRQMERYNLPKKTGKSVLYPILNNRKLTADEIRDRFPRTWEYLNHHKGKLQNRKPVQRGQLKWWELVRPRSPERIFRPKIVSPHLVLIPRFSLDLSGKYAISRTCYIYPKETVVEKDLLLFLVAILNSPICHWYVSTHSHKYGRSYTMLEPKTLKTVPVPDLANVSSSSVERLVSLVKTRLRDSAATYLESEIDNIVVELYGLTHEEQQSMGIR